MIWWLWSIMYIVLGLLFAGSFMSMLSEENGGYITLGQLILTLGVFIFSPIVLGFFIYDHVKDNEKLWKVLNYKVFKFKQYRTRQVLYGENDEQE